MTQETLKKIYQLLLTEPHAPTVCAQLERIAREALAEHAMRETQRLGQEIEPDDIASILACRDMLDTQPVPPRTWVGSGDLEDSNAYLTPPQRKPLTGAQISAIGSKIFPSTWNIRHLEFARAIEAAHGSKENT